MNEIYIFAGFATVVVGVIILVVLAFKSNSLLWMMGDTNQDLANAIQTYKRAVDNLPKQVSQDLSREVRAGIDPTRQELETLTKQVGISTKELLVLLDASHTSLSKTLATVNTDGALSEWVGTLRETIEPLQAATSALDRHYQTSERILDKTGELIIQWTSQRQVVENAFTKFSATIEAWAANETTQLRDIEPRILERLQEVSSTNSLVAQGFSQLESSQTHLSDAQRKLSECVERISLDLLTVVDGARQNQDGHQGLIRRQTELHEQLKTLQTEMQFRGEQFETQTKEALINLTTAHGQLVSDMGGYIKKLLSTLSQFHDWNKERMEEITVQHVKLINSQRELISEQSKLIPKFESLIYGLPTAKSVNIGLWLLAIQLLLTSAIAYGILTK